MALLSRRMDLLSNNRFAPDAAVTRGDFARHLSFNTPLRQTVYATPRYNDLSGDLARIADSVTAKGSTLRDYGFTVDGMMSASGSSFNPNSRLTRIDLAVALVRALGLDSEARALAGTAVTAT
jgi:serine protease AprX